MMRQYMELKEQYKDAILMFRLGDFYEMFFDDAKLASAILGIALTGRDCGLKDRAPMCGVPYHSVNNYIAKLISEGYKVAICEQLEDPSTAKGLVKRDVVRVITPGTFVEDSYINEKDNNYLLCISKVDDAIGVSYVDLSTGEFCTTQITEIDWRHVLQGELMRIKPSEIIFQENIEDFKQPIDDIKKKINCHISSFNDIYFKQDVAYKKLTSHFKVINLLGFEMEDKPAAVTASGALLQYLTETQKIGLIHINRIRTYNIVDYMVLDSTTRRNLELVETIINKTKKGSLLWLLDKTLTAMGGRMLKNWIQQPLTSPTLIRQRLYGVKEIHDNPQLLDEIKDCLKNIYDIERIISKLSLNMVNGRDLISLKKSIKVLPRIKDILGQCSSDILKKFFNEIDTLDDIFLLIDRTIVEEPPATIREGGIIKAGYNKELDNLRSASSRGKGWIAAMEREERDKTGIKNLKIGFNKVFGYYIEVTKSNYNQVPDRYTRKQTLANCERYITPELKEIEHTILNADQRAVELEYSIFSDIRNTISSQINRMQKTSDIIAKLDSLFSLACVALENDYCMPEINDQGTIFIKDGRHPVVEKAIGRNAFVPNDTRLDNDNRLLIITGPNMAGKSTYMRQVALITLMAQIGSFVPASHANISVVDRIFTRVGASDDLSSGQSTFIVEMTEVANILNNATNNSLIIMDEIGRGTSTFDGLSIAWSVAEYMCSKKELSAKTLFATHYHELTNLEGKIPGVKNYHVSVKEYDDNIIFIRKIKPGGSDKSFGIHVAKLAGLPNEVIERAKEILDHIETSYSQEYTITDGITGNCNNPSTSKVSETVEKSNDQMTLFQLAYNDIIEQLKTIDILNTTPLQAMKILSELQEKAKIFVNVDRG